MRPRIQLSRKLLKNAKATPANVATNLITSGVMEQRVRALALALKTVSKITIKVVSGRHDGDDVRWPEEVETLPAPPRSPAHLKR